MNSPAPLLLSVGDSMSIDDYAGGAGRGAASLLYRNRDDEFPAWAGRDLASAGFTALSTATDGATTDDILRRQVPRVDRAPTVVTVTMGGNDLLGCYGDTPRARTALAGVAARADAILTRLRRLGGPACVIVVTTVYDPSDGTGVLGPAGAAPWPDGPELVAALNTTLTGLAARHGAHVADVHGRFGGHGTTAGDPTGPAARPAGRTLWYCNVVEPNAWGAHEIRAAWWNALDPLRLPGRD